MDKQILTFIGVFLITTLAMASEPNKPNLDNIVGPPKVFKYQGSPHAIFDMGNIKYLFKVTKQAEPYPQCDVVQKIGNELMVVTHTPSGYVFFVEKNPIAFKTPHNPNWNEIVKRTHDKG